MDTSIINLTLDYVADTLASALISEVTDPEDYDTVAAVVRCGRLQDDPTQDTGINILLHPNDPNDAAFTHKLAEAKDIGVGFSDVEWSPYEFGGGMMWLRRYTVEVKIFDDGQMDRSVTRENAQVVLSRAEKVIRTSLNLASLGQDSFGESSQRAQVIDSYLRETGGPGAFVWKGKIRFQTINYLFGNP